MSSTPRCVAACHSVFENANGLSCRGFIFMYGTAICRRSRSKLSKPTWEYASRRPSPILIFLVRIIIRLATRVRIEGVDNLPGQKSVVVCPNHPGTTLDIYSAYLFFQGDLRTMLRSTRFNSAASRLFARLTGAFPVDRTAPSQEMKAHCVELLNQGANLLIFPEGRESLTLGRVGPLKRGAAAFALKADAAAVLPVALHFDSPPNYRGTVYAVLLALYFAPKLNTDGNTATVLAAASIGVLVALLAFVKFTSSLRNPIIPKDRLKRDPGLLAASTLFGALTGSVIAFLLSPILTLHACFAPMSLSLFGVLFANRPRLRVRVCPPISTARFKNDPDGNTMLTEEIHEAIGKELALLSGIEYDPLEARISQIVGSPDGQP